MVEPELRNAQAAMLAGQLEDALNYCNALIDRVPHHAGAWSMRGEILMLSGREDEAVQAHRMAEKFDQVPPVSAKPARQMGQGIKMVRRLGSSFTALGWGLALINFCCLAFSMITFWRVMPEFSKDQQKYRANQDELMKLFGQEFASMVTVSFLVWLGTMLWLTLDLADKEGPWGWMIGGVVFGMLCVCAPYLGPGWLLIPLYLLLGRRKV